MDNHHLLCYSATEPKYTKNTQKKHKRLTILSLSGRPMSFSSCAGDPFLRVTNWVSSLFNQGLEGELHQSHRHGPGLQPAEGGVSPAPRTALTEMCSAPDQDASRRGRRRRLGFWSESVLKTGVKSEARQKSGFKKTKTRNTSVFIGQMKNTKTSFQD